MTAPDNMTYKSAVWHPNTQMSEWDTFDTIVRGQGMYLTDSQGHKMIDAVASMWCNVWGHSEPELVAALRAQAEKLQHSPLFNLTHAPAEKLARMLLDACPGTKRVFYSDNGSTAMEAAFKMAVQYWNNQGASDRHKIVGMEGGYHGDTLGAMMVGYSPKFFGRYGDMIQGRLAIPTPRADAPPEEWAKSLDEAAGMLEQDDSVAAVAMESGAQVAGGVRIYPPRFQKSMGDICRRNDILFILDEVATGLGRLGAMAEYVRQESAPDIVSYGKMLSGGYLPIAATLASRRVSDTFGGEYAQMRHLFHGHTFTGNPLGSAVAVRNLELYRQRNLMKHVSRISESFGEMIREAGQIDTVRHIRHEGLLAGIELKDDWRPPAGISPNRFIFEAGRRAGIYLRTLDNVIMAVPPLAIQDADLKYMVSALLETIRAIS